MKPPEYVTEQRRLNALCRRWRQAGRCAFDTEFIRDDTFEATLCLVQATTDGEIALIDPTAGLDLAPFWSLVTDPDVLTIVHAGKEDFEVCLTHTGKPPRNVFDVQIAAGFVGLGYPLSLARLVHAALGRRIAKGQTLTDWLRRPLTDEQLHYAAEDVAHLPELHRVLSGRLRDNGRAAWAAEEFAAYEQPTLYRKPIEQRLYKVKGSKRLDGLGLLVLERLIEWREQWARARNRPIRSMMRDDVLLSIAKRRPTQPRELEILRGFPHTRKSRVTQQVLEVVREALRIPPEQWPKPHEVREAGPMQKATLSILAGFVRAVCHEEQLAHDLVGSTQRLTELLDYLQGRSPAPPALLRGWREAFIGRRLVALLEGRAALRLVGWPDRLRLDVIARKPRGKPSRPAVRKAKA